MQEAYKSDQVGFPCIISPLFTMGGTRRGISVQNRKSLKRSAKPVVGSFPYKELLIGRIADRVGKSTSMEVVR